MTENLGDRARRVARELNESITQLNTTLRDIEELFRERRGRNAMVPLGKSETLSWDGEFLWVISSKDKKKLLQAPRQMRILAASAVKLLAERAGIVPREAP